MKALTIWQPWASLIMLGFKCFEFRSWAAPKAVRGTRIVIHAGKHKPKPAEMKALIYDCQHGNCGTLGREELCAPAGRFVEQALRDPSLIPLGVALGTVAIGIPSRVTALFPDRDPSEMNAWMWGWPLTDPQYFPVAVPLNGEQGFWNFPATAGIAASVSEGSAPSPLFGIH